MAQVQQQLTLVTQEIAAERKLDIVLAKATIVLVRPELELTDAALALLNQRLPRVRLPELERQ
jgi:Skp family chaperone for outer membrane proteins